MTGALVGTGDGADEGAGEAEGAAVPPADEGRREPSPLAVRGAGLTEGTFTWLWLLGCSDNDGFTTVVIDVAAEAISGDGSLTLDNCGEATALFCIVATGGC